MSVLCGLPFMLYGLYSMGNVCGLLVEYRAASLAMYGL
jgi:hypothetical protein